MHRRVVNGFVLAEKIQALKEIVEYDRRNSVAINLENLSETAEDFDPVINEVPGLGLTLDVGHANLNGSINKSISIIEKFGKLIRHVHLHDNRGGQSLVNEKIMRKTFHSRGDCRSRSTQQCRHRRYIRRDILGLCGLTIYSGLC